jgi:hypothetical protein
MYRPAAVVIAQTIGDLPIFFVQIVSSPGRITRRERANGPGHFHHHRLLYGRSQAGCWSLLYLLTLHLLYHPYYHCLFPVRWILVLDI